MFIIVYYIVVSFFLWFRGKGPALNNNVQRGAKNLKKSALQQRLQKGGQQQQKQQQKQQQQQQQGQGKGRRGKRGNKPTGGGE